MTGEPPDSGGRALPPDRDRQASQDAPSQRRDKRKERALVGSIIAQKYRVLDVLGQGGFGTVYLVEMVAGIVGDRLAMKVLPSELGEDEKLRDGFIQEIRVAMRMVSRYIVQIRDVGVTDDGLLYYTMDYMPGRSLREVLREEKVLSPVRAVRIALRVLRALVAAHNAGVIHRDLKPANIMVDTRSGADDTKVLDFGIATVVRAAPERPTFAGSPHYMPPEQFLGTDFGFYTDTYAVGVILYECLTGRRPFEGRAPRDVYERLKAGPPARVDELAPEVEKVMPGLSDTVHKAIERNPDRRFQTARELFDALQLLARGGAGRPGDASSDDDDDSPAGPARPGTPATTPRKRRSKRARKRSALPWVLVVVGAAAATGIVAWMILDRMRSSESTSREVASQRGPGTSPQTTIPHGVQPTPRPIGTPATGSAAGDVPARASSAPTSTSSTPQPSATASASTSPRADATASSSSPAEVPTRGATQGRPSPADPAATATTETPTRSADELYEEARRLVESDELEKARKTLELATRVDESHTSSYELAAHVLYKLGETPTALRALEQARKLRGGSLASEENVLLARIHLAQSPPAYQNAREILLAVREAEPENADAAALLARVYEQQADDERLVALLEDATERSIDHPVISELHETYIASVERRRDEEHEKLAALAVEAFSKGSFEDAINAALEGIARRRDPGLELLIADARYRLGLLEESEAALARARDLLRAGSRSVPSPTVWRPDATDTRYADWIELFQAAIDYQKLRSRADDAKRRAEARSIVQRVRAIVTDSAGSVLADIAVGIEVAAYGLYADGPSELDQLLRGRGEARLPEIAFLEAEGYMNVASRLKVDSAQVARAREDRLRQLRAEITALEARRRALERDRDRNRATNDQVDEVQGEIGLRVSEGERLQKERAEYERLKKLALESVASARGRIIYLTRRSDLPPDVIANAYYQLGLNYLHQGSITGEVSILRTATNRLLSAIENGRQGADIEERLADTYALRQDHTSAALRYQAAYDLEPTVARCLAAARSYVQAVQKHKAREILLAGRDRFPESKEIRDLLNDVSR